QPAGRVRNLIQATVEMYERCFERLRPGVCGAEIARLAVGIAERRGLQDFLYRSPNHEPGCVAHGIGLSYVEPPELSPRDETILQENMVIVLEPILADRAVGGVKLEDALLITRTGPERLSQLPLWSPAPC